MGNTESVLRSRIWWGVVATALLLRAAIVRVTPGLHARSTTTTATSIHAVALVNTGAYPLFVTPRHRDADRLPGARLPASCWRLPARCSGTELEGPRVVQVLLATAGVGLVGVVAHRIWGRRTALAATALAALSPLLVVYSGSLISEPLFIALELGALACALEARGRPRWAVARACSAAPPRSPGPPASCCCWPSRCARGPPGGAAGRLPRGR